MVTVLLCYICVVLYGDRVFILYLCCIVAGSRSSSAGGSTSQLTSNTNSSSTGNSSSNSVSSSTAAKSFQNLFTRSSSSKPDKRELFIKDTKSGVFFFEPPAEVCIHGL